MRAEGNIQEPKTESEGQRHLLGRAKLQTPNLGDREHEDGEIRDNGRDCIGDPGGHLVDAAAGQLRVPEFLDGDTDEDE